MAAGEPAAGRDGRDVSEGKRAPICTQCNDTHRIHRESGTTVACAWCPVPCERCRQKLGAFCASTPCACSCHAAHHQYRALRSRAPRGSIYIAASSKELARAQQAHAVARAVGWKTPGDWTPEIVAQVRAGLHDRDLTRAQCVAITTRCYAAIDQCDRLVILVPRVETVGAWCELTYATHVAGVEIVASGSHHSPFLRAQVDVFCETDEEAIAR